MKRLRVFGYIVACMLILGSLGYYASSEQVTAKFFGKWKVVRCVAKPLDAELTEEIISDYLGRTYIFGEKSMEIIAPTGNVKVERPFYNLYTLVTEDLSSYQISVDDLAIKEASISRVGVFRSVKDRCEYVGTTFFIKDEDTLLLLAGAFFEMKRVR